MKIEYLLTAISIFGLSVLFRLGGLPRDLSILSSICVVLVVGIVWYVYTSEPHVPKVVRLAVSDVRGQKVYFAPNYPELYEEIYNLLIKCLDNPEIEIFYELYESEDAIRILFVAADKDVFPYEAFFKLSGVVSKLTRFEDREIRKYLPADKHVMRVVWG